MLYKKMSFDKNSSFYSIQKGRRFLIVSGKLVTISDAEVQIPASALVIVDVESPSKDCTSDISTPKILLATTSRISPTTAIRIGISTFGS